MLQKRIKLLLDLLCDVIVDRLLDDVMPLDALLVHMFNPLANFHFANKREEARSVLMGTQSFA